MRLEFDLNNNVEKPELVLGKRNYDKYGSVVNIDNLTYDYNLMSADSISFTVYKELNYEKERLWDEIKERRLIWLKEFNEWFQIDVVVNDENGITKEITGTSLCEAELGQILLKSTEINTENDIAREDYVNPTVFYKPSNTKESLLHRLLKEVPNYSIKYVDESLWNIQRTFSIDGTSIYDELTGEIAEEIGCLFLFDSTDRSISVYDLRTNCNHCGYRGDFNDTCPECGSTDLNYGYGRDTTIFIDSETLAESISLSGKQDEVKNYIKVSGGDDIINAAIAACNPTGTQYIYAWSDRDKEDMSDALVKKLDEYAIDYDTLTPIYQAIMKDVYDAIDEQLKLESTMMPDIETAPTNAQKELEKLTSAKLSPIAVQDVSIASIYTANNAVLGMAKCIVNSTVFKIEIIDSSFTSQTWKGKFKLTNYSDEEDTAENAGYIEVEINDDYAYYVEQKIKKTIDRDDVYLVDIFDVKTDLAVFKAELKKYCLSRLNSFESAYQTIIDTLIEANCGNDSTYGDIYNDLYMPYYNKLIAIQSEIKVRASEIETVDTRLTELEKSREEITSHLNIQNYLGDELWKELCSFRREDSYENSNYISDGLDNSEILAKAQELFDKAKCEAITASTLQMSLSTTMFNLLAIPEFQKLTGMFEGGNWIRIGLDDKIYRLRLIHFKIDFSEIQNIEVEFSDVTQTANGLNDTKSLMDKVTSMATNFSYVAHQAEQGSKSFAELDKIRNDGLNAALYNISNSVNQEFVVDEHGITGRKWDDILGDYSPEQVKMNNNILVYTNDYWQTAKSALGKIEYYNPILKTTVSQYGLIADAVISGILMSNDIIGGAIYSENYSSTTGTYINLNNGDFTFAGGKLVYDSEKDILNLTGKITFEDIDYSSPEAKKALQDSLGITDVQNDIDEFNNASILTPLEKKNMFDNWISIQSEYQKNIELAKAFDVPNNSIVIAYTNAYNTLSTQISKCGLDNLTSSTTIDTKIYSDINNYYATNVDFANLINKEAKRLSEQALIDAKAYSNEEISRLSTSVNKEISELNTELTDTQTYIDGAFKDGVVDDIELSKINQLIKQIEIEKLDVDKQYTSIYNNSFLNTDIKASLKNTYDNYDNAHTSLINSINSAIAILNSTSDQSQKQVAIDNVNSSFVTYKDEITKIYEALNFALDEISTLKVSDLRDSVNKDISDVNTLISDTKTYIDGAFYDQVIDESESASISQLLYRLDTEKVDLDARYNSIYNNLSISTTSKNNLKSAKDAYDTSHTNLISLINTAVSVVQDTTKTDNQKQTAINNMNKGFTDYNSKISALSTAFESAIDSISTNKLDNFINGDYSEFISDIQNQVDGKSETYYSPTQPYENHINVSKNSDYDKLVGDLWYDSDESVKKTYIYTRTANGSNYDYKWMEMEVPAEVFDMADGKAQIFTSKPSNYNKNDLWLIGSDYIPSTISGAKVGYVLVSKNTNSGYTESDWVLSIKYTDDSALQTFIDETYTKKINYLETQEDKKAETWYQASNPVGTSAWTENGKTNTSHKGDIWYNTTDQKTYIYDGSVWKLTTTTPPDEVFDKIDGKAQIFVSTPTTPYHVGDLWFNSNTSDIMTCITKRDSGNFVSSDWEKRNRYTDDSSLTDFINGAYANSLQNIATQIDGKARSWYQLTDPSITWDTEENHEGDLWYNTDSQVTYIYIDSAWKATSVPTEVFDKIDGIASIYVTIPTSPVTGDLLIPINNINSYKAGKVYRYNGTAWTEIIYTDNDAVQKWVNDTYSERVSTLEEQMDGKIETFYQDTDPSTSWSISEKSIHNGDLWYDTSKKRSYIYNGTSWEEMKSDVPDIVYDKIATKKQIFSSQPAIPYYKGDLWVQGSDGDILYCNTTRESGTYNSSDWIIASKYTDDTVANNALNVATQAVSDNILTPSEKRDLINTINNIKATYAKYTTICSVMNISYTSYTSSYNTLINKMTGSSSVYKLDSSVNTTLTSAQVTNFKNYFSNYYTAEANIIQSIQNATNTNVNNAQNAADQAQQDATEALGILADIASDNKITPVEKLQLEDKYNTIKASHEALMNKYDNAVYNTSSDFSNYKTAYNNLCLMCDEILADMTTTYDLSRNITLCNQTKNISYAACDGQHLNSWKTIEFIEVTFTLDSSATLKFDGDVTCGSGVSAERLWELYNSTGNLLATLSEDDFDYNIGYTLYRVTAGTYTVKYYGYLTDTARHEAVTTDDGYYIALWLDATLNSYTRETYNSIISNYYEQYQSFTNKIITDLETGIDTAKALANEAKSLGSELKKCLGFSTEISSDYVISPFIGGGYLNTTGTSGKVIIDPSQISNSTHIFSVYNSSDNLVVGVDVSGNGVFNGTITANNGKIGGWYINSNGIYMDDTGISSNNYYYAFWAGETNGTNGLYASGQQSDAKFKVTHAGELISTDADITGKITSSEGNIAGWTLTSSAIYKNYSTFGASGGMYFGANGLSIGSNFKVTSTGTVTANGTFATGISGTFAKLVDNSLTFYKDSTELSSFSTTYWDGTSIYGTSVHSETSSKFISFGNKSASSDTSYATKFLLNYSLNPNGITDGVIVFDSFFSYGNVITTSSFYLNNPGVISLTSGRVAAWDGTAWGINTSSSGTGLYVFGNIGCSGTKARVVHTEHYGEIELNAYETATPYFGDLGSGECDENGLCYIYLDEIFKETIINECDYYVFLQQYGEFNVYPIEKNKDYFVVKGEPYQKFDFEIKCRQIGTDNMRLNRVGDRIESEE